MNVLFFANAAGREAILLARGIPFDRFTMSRTEGFLIDPQYVVDALTAMRLRIDNLRSSGYDGVTIADLTPAGRSPRHVGPTLVSTSAWYGWRDQRDKAEYERVARQVADGFKVRNFTLHLDLDHSKYNPQYDPDTFRVLMWGVPADTNRNVPSAEKLWDIRIGEAGSWDVWRPVREEDVITDDTGTPVAEMIGNNLYIYYPVYSSEMRRGVAVFRKILEAALASRGTPRKRAALRKAREEARLARIRAEAEERISRIRAEGEATRDTSRETYVTACAGRFEHTVADTRRAIEKSGSEVEELQAKLVEAIRRGSGLQRKLSQMLTVREGDRGAYAREFDKLFSVPNVIDVRVDRGTIVVFTDTLYCVDPRTSRKHEIGAFRITIRMDGAVTWNNETRKIHGYDAPHVDGGKACLGNVSEVLPQLAGNYEYAALVMVAIQFIESVNVDDPWGETINQWPIAA